MKIKKFNELVLERNNYSVFLGYHTSNCITESGLHKGNVLDTDEYSDVINMIYSNIFKDNNQDDIYYMNEVFEKEGYSFTFVSETPVINDLDEYRYGENLYKVYGNGNEILFNDGIHEFNSNIVVSKSPLYFKKIKN